MQSHQDFDIQFLNITRGREERCPKAGLATVSRKDSEAVRASLARACALFKSPGHVQVAPVQSARRIHPADHVLCG
jgi:hypothetical protein